MKSIDYIVRVHEEDGSYWAEALDLPGCFASGETLDELREALGEAIGLYLRDERGGTDDSETSAFAPAAPAALSVGEMRITIAA